MNDALFDANEQPEFAHGRTLVIAMSGWNDAGEAASTAVSAMMRQLAFNHVCATFDDDAYYDFAAARPHIVRSEDGTRSLRWPSTKIHSAPEPQTEADAKQSPNPTRLYALTGTEPSMRWRQYSKKIVDYCLQEQISRIVVVGALLADTPHTRDIPVQLTSDDAAIQREFGIDSSQYEGPTGIMSAITELAAAEGIPALSLWAQVPHYASTPDSVSPKAVFALMRELERVLQVSLDTASFVEAGQHWQAQVSNAIAMDEELQHYVTFLEQARDTVESDAASGDAIAAEFERFLADETPRDDNDT